MQVGIPPRKTVHILRDLENIISELETQKAAIEKALAALRDMAGTEAPKRRGHPPGKRAVASAPPTPPAKRGRPAKKQSRIHGRRPSAASASDEEAVGREAGSKEGREARSKERNQTDRGSTAMTRSNLIDEIAAKTERTKKDAEQMLDAVLATITGAPGRGEKVDFGDSAVSS
jgi:hypothetical protein